MKLPKDTVEKIAEIFKVSVDNVGRAIDYLDRVDKRVGAAVESDYYYINGTDDAILSYDDIIFALEELKRYLAERLIFFMGAKESTDSLTIKDEKIIKWVAEVIDNNNNRSLKVPKILCTDKHIRRAKKRYLGIIQPPVTHGHRSPLFGPQMHMDFIDTPNGPVGLLPPATTSKKKHLLLRSRPKAT